MSSFFKVNRNSSAAVISMIGVALTYLWIALMSEAPAGGQDSWNHYLYARWAPEHPQLLLDQWGKPFFTFCALPFAKFGISGVYWLNFIAIMATCWLTYLTGRKLNLRNPWLLVLFVGWQPVVMANVHSALTEPTNALVLIGICYLFVSQKTGWAVFAASFLPIVRSEGMILLLALLPFLLIRGKWKYLPLLFVGTFAFAVFSGIVSNEPLYFIHNNPYIHHEMYGKFDPGSGSFWHYAQEQRQITGVVLSSLIVLSLGWIGHYAYRRFAKKTPEELSQFVMWLFWPLLLSFFLAHSYIWFKGSMGSHGLLRVFVVVSPVAALLGQYSLHKLMSLDIAKLNRSLKIILVCSSVFIGIGGANMPMPWTGKLVEQGFPGQPQIDQALQFIHHQKLENKVLVHQMPALNERLGFDPWAEPANARTFYLWSIDVNPGKDWMPDSTVVIWDNFHGRRDAPMPLHVMKSLPQYQEIAYFPSNTDPIYDLRVFIKSRKDDREIKP